MWPVYERGIATYFGPAVREGGDLRATMEAVATAAAAPSARP
jgi:hypothetical protein